MPSFSCQFSEVILYVRDMGRAVHFYHDLLGFPIRFPQGQSDLSQEMWVELETGNCPLALHGGSGEAPARQHELVFTVLDITAARDALVQAGVAMDPIRTLEDGAPIASGLDPEGHRFAICA